MLALIIVSPLSSSASLLLSSAAQGKSMLAKTEKPP